MADLDPIAPLGKLPSAASATDKNLLAPKVRELIDRVNMLTLLCNPEPEPEPAPAPSPAPAPAPSPAPVPVPPVPSLPAPVPTPAPAGAIMAPLFPQPRKQNGQPIAWDLARNRPAEDLFPFRDVPANPSGIVRRITSAAEFPAAVNALLATGGVVEVPAGMVLAPFKFPGRAAAWSGAGVFVGAPWIIIRSSAHTMLPPAGSRVKDADAAHCFTFRATNVNEAALTSMAYSSGYRLVGFLLENTAAANDDPLWAMAPGYGNWYTKAAAPNNQIGDRGIFRGRDWQKRGWQPAGFDHALVGSRLSGFNHTDDTQNICTWDFLQRCHIENCYLGAAAELIMFGGNNQAMLDGSYVDTWPTDWVIGGCEFADDDGQAGRFTRKCVFESKNSSRGVIHSSVIHGYRLGRGSHDLIFNIGAQAQAGTVTAAATKASYLTIRGNLISGCTGHVISFGGNNGTAATEVSHHNEFSYNYGWGYVRQGDGHGVFKMFTRDCVENVVAHNVFVGWTHSYGHFAGYGQAPNGFGPRVIGNAFPSPAAYDWWFSDFAFSGVNAHKPDELWKPGNWQIVSNFDMGYYAFQFVGGTPNNAGSNRKLARPEDFGFADLAGRDFALLGTSPLKGAAPGGRDVGGHWPTFVANITGVVTG